MRPIVIVAIACTGIHFFFMNFVLLGSSSSKNNKQGGGGGIETWDGQLRVAWLMSYPNSGTSFTVHVIRSTSNTTTATNYGWDDSFREQQSVPVFGPSSPSGPYLQETKPYIPTAIPKKFIMTKTHCGGYCFDCKPHNYIHTTRSFKQKCLTGNRAAMSVNDTEPVPEEELTYSGDFVKKAIHIYRHPMDNIVSRFHLTYKAHQVRNDTDWITEYPNSVTGFQRWCRLVDSMMPVGYLSSLTENPRMANVLVQLPCMVEFYRYVQWHNLANSLVRDMDIPSLTIHYDWYHNDFDNALKLLLDFLELPQVQPGEAFESGKTYRNYYTQAQRDAVKSFLQKVSSPDTWRDVIRYFPSELEAQQKQQQQPGTRATPGRSSLR